MGFNLLELTPHKVSRDLSGYITYVYGRPKTGKTTLARVIANHTKSNFITLNAVLTGVAEIRSAIKQADDYFKLYGKLAVIFYMNAYRNKKQKDDKHRNRQNNN